MKNRLERAETSNVTSHSVQLTGLSAGTRYYYIAGSKDQMGNAASSTEMSFATSSAGESGCSPSVEACPGKGDRHHADSNGSLGTDNRNTRSSQYLREYEDCILTKMIMLVVNKYAASNEQ